MKYLWIRVDANDADYNELLSPITDADVALLIPLIEAIKAFEPYKGRSASGMEYTHHHNYPFGEYSPREDLGEKSAEELYTVHGDAMELFNSLAPFGAHGFHSIKRIAILEVASWTNLL